MLPLPRLGRGIWHRTRPYSCINHAQCRLQSSQPSRRTILAIETSCDDTAVAVLQVNPTGHPETKLLFNKKITANNAGFHGIHPMVAHESHQAHLSTLINEALFACTPSNPSDRHEVTKYPGTHYRPNLVAVTRGPGMRSNLTTGLDTAKGLAVAWGVPLLGVHHMQAHALTPRLINALDSSTTPDQYTPSFPFLTLLVSGGHTTLLRTESVTGHQILAETSDIAIGDAIDKIGRVVVPPHLLESQESVSFGPVLERFAFPQNADGTVEYDYKHGASPQQWAFNKTRREREFGWTLPTPLQAAEGGGKRDSMEFSFTGVVTYAQRIARFGYNKETKRLGKTPRTAPISDEEARLLAQEAQRVVFTHLASRVVTALRNSSHEFPVRTLVVSGGVASNSFLRHLLRSYLDATGFPDVAISVPPIEYCTDNAAMIAWAAWEMQCAGHGESGLDIRALRKWSLENVLRPENEEDTRGTTPEEVERKAVEKMRLKGQG